MSPIYPALAALGVVIAILGGVLLADASYVEVDAPHGFYNHGDFQIYLYYYNIRIVPDRPHMTSVDVNRLVTYDEYRDANIIGGARLTYYDMDGNNISEKNWRGYVSGIIVPHDKVFDTTYNATFRTGSGVEGWFLFKLPVPGGPDYPHADIGFSEDPIVHHIAHDNAKQIEELEDKAEVLRVKVKSLEAEVGWLESRLEDLESRQ